nr:chaplin [Streptomyces sp. ML-6]
MATGAGAASATGHGAGPDGTATHSPGGQRQNTVQAPVHVPVAAVGNTADVTGLSPRPSAVPLRTSAPADRPNEPTGRITDQSEGTVSPRGRTPWGGTDTRHLSHPTPRHRTVRGPLRTHRPADPGRDYRPRSLSRSSTYALYAAT